MFRFLASSILFAAFALGQQGPVSWTHADLPASGASGIGRVGFTKWMGFNGRTCSYEKNPPNASSIYSNAFYCFTANGSSAAGLIALGTSATTVESNTNNQPWQATHAYVSTGNGTIINDAAFHVQRVTTGGTSGGSLPTWNHSGGTTTDGSVTWTDNGYPFPADRHPIQQMWVDNNRHRIYLAGGTSGSGSSGNPESAGIANLWYTNPDTDGNNWHALLTTHTPADAGGKWDWAGSAWDGDDNIELQWGRKDDSDPAILYIYCPTDLNPTAGALTAIQTSAGCLADDWVQVTTTGGPPTEGDFPSLNYVGHGQFILFGGQAAGTPMNETWLYQITNDGVRTAKSWTLLNNGSSNAPPAITYGYGGVIHQQAMDFVPTVGLLYVWDYINGHMWTLDPVNGGGKWHDQGASSGPVCNAGSSAQCGESIAYDQKCNCIVAEALTTGTFSLSLWIGQLAPYVSGLGASTITCKDKKTVDVELYDVNKDSFVCKLAESITSVSPAGKNGSFAYNYPAKTLLPLLKKVSGESISFILGEKGILQIFINEHSIMVLPLL